MSTARMVTLGMGCSANTRRACSRYNSAAYQYSAVPQIAKAQPTTAATSPRVPGASPKQERERVEQAERSGLAQEMDLGARPSPVA